MEILYKDFLEKLLIDWFYDDINNIEIKEVNDFIYVSIIDVDEEQLAPIKFKKDVDYNDFISDIYNYARCFHSEIKSGVIVNE